MLSKKVLVVILLIVGSFIVACGAPPPPPNREAPSGQAPGSQQEQATPVSQQPPDEPTPPEEPKEPPAGESSAQQEVEQPSPNEPAIQGGPEGQPDLALAAKALGITEQQLMEALGPPPPDLAATARTLGITEQELQNALFPVEETGEGSNQETGQESNQEVGQESSQTEAVDTTDSVLSTQRASCADYVNAYNWDALDVATNRTYMGSFMVEVSNGKCIFTSNGIPNHNFDDAGGFVTDVREQNQSYSVTANPQRNASPTPLSLQYDNAILLDGIKVDLLAAGCYGVGDGKIGCFEMGTPWRYDPMSPHNDFGTDSHNAHTQPDGTYHYHGNPKALFDDSDSSAPSPVIGFAADGFPIFGSYFNDNGTIRKARPSYQLRSGSRPSGAGNPGGTYDGSFVDDYEYIEGSGDLDQCNGMVVDGIYGYYVTDAYPHIIGCFSGTPDDSFRKRR